MFHYKKITSKLPSAELEKIGEAVGVDYRVRKLTGENIFNLLLYSILKKNELSLRTIEENYRRMFNLDTRHSSVASRLKTISVEYFERIFSFVLQSFCSLKNQQKLLIIDSTTLQLSSKLLQLGIPCRNKKYCEKNMIKCTVATDGRFAKLLNLHTQAEDFSDHNSFREMILNHGQESICIFNRGLQKRATFEEFMEENIHFVTRGNDNIRYQIVRIHTKITGIQTETLELIEDVIVRLGQKGSRFLSFEIRLIKAKNKKSGEILTFLTNIYEASAEEICALYKKRWSIEVFFKFIKQELNTKHFLGYSKNTILVTLYMILIASVLLTKYRKCSEIKSYKFARRAFMNELRLEVLKPVIEYCGGNPEKIYDYYLRPSGKQVEASC